MNFFFKMKENRFFISLGDCFCRLLSPWTPLAVLLIIAMYVMFGEYKYISELLGVSNKEAPKNEILKIIGILMGGILVIWQAWASHKRAKAMEGTAESQARANENTEKGLRQERLKNAIEHLGHEKDSVSLGGAYELFHLVEDNEELKKTAFDMLCLHIRQTTGENEYQEKHESKPSEEVQSLLTLLFVQDHEVFKGLQINLQGSWLNGANLREARLEKAILTEAQLQGATLAEAQLQEANLVQACLQEADLRKARLQRANLERARLQRANLERARLQRANLERARLQRAKLSSVRLQGADLWEARLQETYLEGAYLQGANLERACLQGADLLGAYLQGAFLKDACLQGANLMRACLQGADLNRTCLQGANLWKAYLQGATSLGFFPMCFRDRISNQFGKKISLSDAIFADGLDQGDADSIERYLKDRGAITEAYTEAEAEKWIAEYKEAMSEVLEGDN